MRIRRLLAVALLIVSLAATAAPATSQAAASQPATVQIAILGHFEEDENEPDENEADEGGGSRAEEAEDDGASAGISFLQVGLVLALMAIAGIWVARWFFRIRSWIRRPAS